MVLLKIKPISLNGVTVRSYIYKNDNDEVLLLAIPDLNWSLEIDTSLNDDDIKEELVIHLFTLLDESTAVQIADDIGQSIFEN